MKREFRQLRLSQLDRNVELARSLPPRPSGGWISSVREALGISQREVGKKMHASGQAIQQFEQAEAEPVFPSAPFEELREAWGANSFTHSFRVPGRSRNWRSDRLASEPHMTPKASSTRWRWKTRNQKTKVRLIADEANRRLNRRKNR